MNTIFPVIIFCRINHNFELRLSLSSITKIGDRFIEADSGVYRLTCYQGDGVKLYSFGFNASDHKPDHGGEWSSNSYQINKIFSVDISECGVTTKDFLYGYMAMACDKEFIRSICPESLVYNDGKLYENIDFPHGDDYFSSTVLNADGELIYPTVESMERAIIKFKTSYGMSDDSPRIKHMHHWINRLKAVTV